MALALRVPADAAVDGYSLTLTVSPDSPEVRAGTTLTYTIDASEPASPPSALGVAYRFITPAGTTFVSARAVAGARIIGIRPPFTTPSPAPVGQADVVIDAQPTAPDGSITVTVRVDDIWQGVVAAQAFFTGNTPLAASNTVAQAVTLPDGVPGQLVAHRFIDLNGNGVLDPEDFPASCEVDVYAATLAGRRIPDDLTGSQDPRLPLVAFALTGDTGTARITLLPGRYFVYFFACQTPTAPPGAFTVTDVIARPPFTKLVSVSGANTYEVQRVDIASTQLTDLVYAERPAGPLAPPTDLRLDGRTLTWTDNATGETGYRVQINSTVSGASGSIDLPPDSTTYTIASSFLTPCGQTSLQIAVSAVDANGGVSLPARTSLSSIADCPGPPITPPNTGDGAMAGTTHRAPFAVAFLCVAFGALAIGSARLLKRR